MSRTPSPDPPLQLIRFLYGIAFIQILIVSWDAIALMERYGIRRTPADCAAYLGAARSLLEGQGLRTVSLLEPLPYGWMTDWPLGYPAVLALAVSITGMEPFYVSRWLNIGLLLLTLFLCYLLFRPQAPWIFLWIYPPNYTWNVAYALSENLFLPLLVGLVGTIQRYHEERRTFWLWLISFWLAAIFLTRYHGIAAGMALGIYGIIYLLRRRWREAIPWLGLAVWQALFAAGYFVWNAYHHPNGESGLYIRDMPMPAGFWEMVWEEVPFVRFVGLVGIFTALVWLWRGRPHFSPAEYQRRDFLLLLFLTQAALYLWSMWRGRIGILDMRHFVIIALPLLWYWAEILWRHLPGYAILGIAVIFLLWQFRNTYRHTRWAYEKAHVSYAYAEKVRQAYDTLPPGSCIIGGSFAYPIKGRRTDLCIGDASAYFPILLRDCPCLYIDCGLLEERFKLGLWGRIFWPFVKFCDKPCEEEVCLRKIGCASSPLKNSGDSP